MVWSRNSQGLPPAKLSEKNLIHISKEQNPRLSDGPRPPTLWPQLQGQKGESELGVGGEALPHGHHQPQSVHREGLTAAWVPAPTPAP